MNAPEKFRVAMLEQSTFDAILMDVQMPVMSGRQLIDQLRLDRSGLKVL